MKFGKFLLRELKIPSKTINWEDIIHKFHLNHVKLRRGIHSINQHVAWFFEKDPLEVQKYKGRREELILPKQIAIYIALRFYNLPSKEVAIFY
ncbi:MAG: hypothetical protein ACTSQF_01995, partial [Candidatus Heimdallarchaeaceae archaeon]